MDMTVMHAVMTETEAGKLKFPDVVLRLLGAGVESYFVDLASGQEIFYLTGGESHSERMKLPRDPIAEEFSPEGLVAAIRGAQADTVRYPEFVQRSAAAGVIGYWAFLTGKKVIYFGRKGETHVEEFPRAQS
jgi:uncharacterized protein YbcV (DUF1398 family)